MTRLLNSNCDTACKRKTCEKCRYFKRCVIGKKAGRLVQRNPNTVYYHWADDCLTKHQRRRLLSRRRYKVEGSFADGANNHGFKRARWRGLMSIEIQNLMIAAIQNLRKLLRYGCDGGRLNSVINAIDAVSAGISVVWCRLLIRCTAHDRIGSY